MRGSAYAIFCACQQSHAFDDRRVLLPNSEDQAVKIGRSVARWKPASDNAIFDCKVLSRNHAVIWYEDGRFYLRDTKSSNGTFVNNQRLSKGGEESAPKELLSGDLIQFGVDIVENSNKVTHGCIIAMVRLFHADDTEAAMTREVADLNDGNRPIQHDDMMNGERVTAANTINSQELFQLQQYIREATHREHALEQKLTILNGLLASAHDASENTWQALINEDRLLSRIEMLEAQLQAYSKTANEDKLRDEVLSLQDDRHKYESVAKESLRSALQEKTEAIQKLFDVERSLETTEEECSCYRQKCHAAETQLLKLSNTYALAEKRIEDLMSQLQDTERRLEHLKNSEANVQYAQLRDDYAQMEKRCQQLDNELNTCHQENARIIKETENSRQLIEKISTIPTGASADNSSINEQIVVLQLELDATRKQLLIANSEIYRLNRESGITDNNRVGEIVEYRCQTSTILFMSTIPLLVVIVAIIGIFLRFFAYFSPTRNDRQSSNLD